MNSSRAFPIAALLRLCSGNMRAATMFRTTRKRALYVFCATLRRLFGLFSVEDVFEGFARMAFADACAQRRRRLVVFDIVRPGAVMRLNGLCLARRIMRPRAAHHELRWPLPGHDNARRAAVALDQRIENRGIGGMQANATMRCRRADAGNF